jgi:Cu/Ag efflux protein CusF
MLPCRNLFIALLFVLWMLNVFSVQSAELGLARVLPTQPVQADQTSLAFTQDTASARIFAARSIVREISPAAGTLVIQHEAVSNFMEAMTMPFKIKSADELAGLRRGDAIAFRLHVTENKSWVNGIVKTGTEFPVSAEKSTSKTQPVPPVLPLLDCKFTNELRQARSTTTSAR